VSSRSVDRPGKPVALTDWAYERLKAMLLSLQIEPGAQLQTDGIAREMGVSRTPLREAILRLEKEGLVRIVPRVGIFSTEITRRDLDELYELRELLESRALEDATPHITEEDLAQVDFLLERTVAAAKEQDTEAFLQAEVAFHSYLLRRCGNRRLITIVEGFQDLTYRWRVLSIRSQASLSETVAEHRQIVDALRRRDPQLAGELMRDHIRAARERIREVVEPTEALAIKPR